MLISRFVLSCLVLTPRLSNFLFCSSILLLHLFWFSPASVLVLELVVLHQFWYHEKIQFMTFKLTQDKNKQMQQQKIEEQKNKTIDNLGVMMRHNLLHIVWISILNFEFLNF